MAIQKIRLDKLLVDRGIAPTLERARALILARVVKINETYLDKAGAPVAVNSEIQIKGQDNPYVSRGGLKLEAALKEFKLNVANIVALDVGASTGGFQIAFCRLVRAKFMLLMSVTASWPGSSAKTNAYS